MEQNKIDVTTINEESKEQIYDMSFDWYGKRLAVITGDRKVKIYKKDKSGRFQYSSKFNGHQGPIWRVKWAHPDFGSVIATCSFDNTIIIWEEDENTIISNEQEVEKLMSTWVEKGKLYVRSDSVEDIKFSPKHMGFMIGAVYANGKIIIWDINQLSSDSRKFEEKLTDRQLTSITWNKNCFDTPIFIVGMGPPESAQEVFVKSSKGKMRMRVGRNRITHGNKGVSGKKTPNQQSMVKEDPKANCLQLYMFKDRWVRFGELKDGMLYHSQGVYDISWASLNARSYHTVVSCGRDGIIVWKFNLETKNGQCIGLSKVQAQLLRVGDGSIPIRVSWNFMSTLIVASSNNNQVSIWKKKRNGDWELEVKNVKSKPQQQIQVPQKLHFTLQFQQYNKRLVFLIQKLSKDSFYDKQSLISQSNTLHNINNQCFIHKLDIFFFGNQIDYLIKLHQSLIYMVIVIYFKIKFNYQEIYHQNIH